MESLRLCAKALVSPLVLIKKGLLYKSCDMLFPVCYCNISAGRNLVFIKEGNVEELDVIAI